jgi:hypothetical protein
VPDQADTKEVLDALLDELDLTGQAQHAAKVAKGNWASRRTAPRQRFRAPCTVRFLEGQNRRVSQRPGRTRNLSRNGVGFVARRAFAIGEPVEVELRVPGRPPMFIAGTVEFCRSVGRGSHEVGVAVRAAQSQPIFSGDPAAASKSLRWFGAALDAVGQASEAVQSGFDTLS